MKPERILRDDVDYIPAPVWHDAKEPPEKRGDYICAWKYDGKWSSKQCYYTPETNRWVLMGETVLPNKWTPIPQPPTGE